MKKVFVIALVMILGLTLIVSAYDPKNEVGTTLSSSFVHGTDVTASLTSATGFPASGGYMRITGVQTDSEWCLYEYTGVAANDLTGLTLCTEGNVESTASHTFAAGSLVDLVCAAEYLKDLNDEMLLWTQDRDADGQALTGLLSLNNLHFATEYADLATAVSTIQTESVTLVIEEVESVTSDLTIPTTMDLWFLRSGEIEIQTGSTTLYLPRPPIAGLYQIFSGDGVVSFEGVKHPEWWAGAPDGSIDFAAAINACLNNDNTTIIFSNRAANYMYSDILIVDKSNITIIGYGATLQATATSGDSYGFYISGGLGLGDPPITNVRMMGLTIDADHDGGRAGTEGSSSVGIFNATDCSLKDLTLIDAPGSNVHIGKATADAGIAYRVYCENIYAAGSILNNVSVVGAEQVTFNKCQFLDAANGSLSCGIDIEPNYGSTNKYITVKDCTITGNEDYAVYLNLLNEHIIIQGNYIVGNSGSGIVIDNNAEDVLIQGNYINGNGSQGITTQSPWMRIVGNYIGTPAAACIHLAAGADYSIVTGNFLGYSSNIGIQCDADYVTITGNIIENCTTNGITTTATSSHCSVADNIIKGGDNGGIANFMLQDNGSYNLFTGNDLYSSEGEAGNLGMRFDGTHARAFNNSCIGGKVLDGLQIFGSTDPAIMDIAFNNWDGTLGYAVDFEPAEEISTSVALSLTVPSNVDSSGGVLALTLADGQYNGQQKMVTMSVAGNNADLTIAHHLTADNEVARFDAVGEFLSLVWSGADWLTVANTCTFP